MSTLATELRPPPTNPALAAALIAAITVLGAAALLLMIVLVVWWRKRRARAPLTPARMETVVFSDKELPEIDIISDATTHPTTTHTFT